MEFNQRPLPWKTLLALTLAILVFSTCKKHDKSYSNMFPPAEHQFGVKPAPTALYAQIPSSLAPPPSGSLPSSFALDIPQTAFNQGPLGSCASSASSMAKSILDHIQKNTSYLNNGIIYSPSYLFDQLNLTPGDCVHGGTYAYANLDVLKSQGICTIMAMPYSLDCSVQPVSTQISDASANKIDHYFRLDPITTLWIKQFIYAGLPVIVVFQVDNFFENATSGSIWKEFTSAPVGSHCTLLYGWDDSKNAFKMLNSWGPTWGDNGSVWVDYNFVQNGTSAMYGKIFTEAYIIQNPAVVAQPVINVSTNQSLNTTVGNSQNTSVNISNTGKSALVVSSFSLQNNSGAFNIGGNTTFPITIPSLSSFSVAVSFTPKTTGTFTCNFVVNSNASSGNNSVGLSGIGNNAPTNTFTDSRDGHVYQIVTIGTQTWMAQDLLYNDPNSVVNNGTRLYDYNTAINIAPSGWHLPTDVEWQTLETYLGMSSSDAALDGWRGSTQGTQIAIGGSSGLNLNYTSNGVRNSDNSISFYDYGVFGYYWTSSKWFNNNSAVNNYMSRARGISTRVPGQIFRFDSDLINNYYAIRCIKNN